MSRPTKLTGETVDGVLTALRAGLSYRLAAEANGIHPDTLHEWRQGRFPRGADPELKTRFSEGITRAKAEGAMRLATIIADAAPTDWRAAGWLLERVHPADFGKDADLHARLDALEAALAGGSAPTPLRKVS
jgi:hypothetical protein